MKTIFYIFLSLSAILVSQSDSFRSVLKLTGESLVDKVIGAVTGVGYIEVRSVDQVGLDKAISQQEKLIIVLFWDEFSPESKKQTREIQEILKEASGKVMLCKVAARKNAVLAEQMNVTELPTIMIYSAGDLVNEYDGVITPEHLLATVNSYLDTSVYGSGRGSIEPLKGDWTPAGVYKSETNSKNFTPL